MNNSEVFQFFCEHKSHSYRSIAGQFIASFGFEQSDLNLFRLKFNDIQKERDLFTKNSDIDTWNSMYFCHIPKRPKLSSTSTKSFEEDLNITKRKAIGDLTTKALRNRLSSLKSHKRVEVKPVMFWGGGSGGLRPPTYFARGGALIS